VSTPEQILEPSPPLSEDALETLRDLLFGEQVQDQRQRLAELRALLDHLEGTLNDDAALAQRIAPVMSDAIATSLRDSRPAMIDALYPIIGQLVMRAVTEAMRELAQRIDHQMRTALNVQGVARQLRARLSGISPAEMALRDALPFHVEEVFLIHRESGLLLKHLSWQPASGTSKEDSEIISGMLTAIRDFVQDAFARNGPLENGALENAQPANGQQNGAQLDTVQYGDKSIIIESAQHIYAAVVTKGIEPTGFRAYLRKQVVTIEADHAPLLRHYNGDASQLAAAATHLAAVLQTHTPAAAPSAPLPEQSAEPAAKSTQFHFDPNTILLLIFFLMVLFASGWLVWLLLY
jgi:hypothetical protein